MATTPASIVASPNVRRPDAVADDASQASTNVNSGRCGAWAIDHTPIRATNADTPITRLIRTAPSQKDGATRAIDSHDYNDAGGPPPGPWPTSPPGRDSIPDVTQEFGQTVADERTWLLFAHATRWPPPSVKPAG